MENLYNELNHAEQEEFKRMVNQLFGKTFIVHHIYDTTKRNSVMNPEYRFIEKNKELFQEYFKMGGWKLEQNSDYEVFYVTSEYGYNKVRLDKFTTIILYLLRLMYDQKRENIHLTEHIIVSVGEVVNTLNEIGAYHKKKPSVIELKQAFGTIASFNVIQKMDGSYDQPETKMIILPSILFAVTAESIGRINESINEMQEENTEAEEIEENVGEEVE